MSLEVAQRCIDILRKSPSIKSVDLTGTIEYYSLLYLIEEREIIRVIIPLISTKLTPSSLRSSGVNLVEIIILFGSSFDPAGDNSVIPQPVGR